jgi:hypothetical protein
MISFFDVDEEDSKEKDTASTTLASKDVTSPAVDVAISGSPKVELMPAVVTPSANITCEEKIGSSKPMMAQDKRKGLAKLKRPRRLLNMTCCLVMGLLIKSWGIKGIEFITLLGRPWVRNS